MFYYSVRSTRGYFASPYLIRNETMIEELINSEKRTDKSYRKMSSEEQQK